MSIYAPDFAHKHNAPQRIAAAYTTAGLTPPSFTTEVDDALAAMPTVATLSEQLGREALTATDPHEWIEQATEQLGRAMVTDTLAAAVRAQRQAAISALLPSVLTAASTDLAPAFDKHARALARAAAALPAEEPLSTEAAVIGDHGKHLRTARECLAALSVMGSAWGAPDDAARVLRGAQGRALVVVDIPTVEVEIIANKGRGTANPDETRDNVRQFLEDAETDADRTLIAVARGDYGEQVRLALPDYPRAVSDRYYRAKQALLRMPGPPERQTARVVAVHV